MEPIEINKATPELADQLTFLISQEFYITYNRYQYFPFYLFGFTIIVIALSIFTDSESLIALKGVSIMLTLLVWLITIIWLFTILIKRYNREVWKRKSIKHLYLKHVKYQLSFDSEKIYFTTDDFTSEIKWSYYKYYAIHKNSIFIFRESNVYEAIYYSQNELGTENYERLKTIVSKSLIEFVHRQGLLQRALAVIKNSPQAQECINRTK